MSSYKKPPSEEIKKHSKKLEHKVHIAEKEHFQKATLYEDLVENAVEGIYRSTEDGYYLFVNRQFAHILGYNNKQDFLDNVSNAALIYENSGTRLSICKTMRSQGFIKDKAVKLKRRDGSFIWVNLSGRTVPQPSGNLIYEGFIADIMDRKKAEESLQESEERFRVLVKQAGDAFFITDYEGHIIDVNPLACESLGYTHAELLSMRIQEIDNQADKRGIKPHLLESLEFLEVISFEGIHQRKDGYTFPVEVRLSQVDVGNRHLLLSLARDITERKKSEDKLKKAFIEIKKLKSRLEQENIYLRQEIETQYNFDDMVGESPAFNRVLIEAEKVAREDTCVLILGETGTGKELLARAIQHMSLRKERPMIKVNCAALPSSLIESELFGREKGAFTGAVAGQMGRFEAADGSTIFLDEIGDLPLELQTKLLRVLQDGSFERLGSLKTISVDVRIIAATNQDLTALVKKTEFRSDLFYRLNVFPITLPPLRDRLEDIPLLALAFVKEYALAMGKPIKQIPREIMTRMKNYSWPGNIREMRNIIERAMILSPGNNLEIDHLGVDEALSTTPFTLEEIDRNHILEVLDNTGWRVSGPLGAARRLGLKESTLRWRMRKLGIARPTGQ